MVFLEGLLRHMPRINGRLDCADCVVGLSCCSILQWWTKWSRTRDNAGPSLVSVTRKIFIFPPFLGPLFSFLVVRLYLRTPPVMCLGLVASEPGWLDYLK